MDQTIHLAAEAANSIFQAQAIHSNNLANISTHGFKADLAYIEKTAAEESDALIDNENGSTQGIAVDFTPGTIIPTGRSLDIAIEGEGFIAVQTKDNTEAFTRAGNLKLDAAGVLITSRGLPVIGNGGPIVIPQSEALEIGKDGTISIRPIGQTANALAVINRIKLVNPEAADLQKGVDGLFRDKNGKPQEPDASVKLIAGALESSNVNAVQELTEIISLARQFEAQLKMMNSIEKVDTKTESLMSMTG